MNTTNTTAAAAVVDELAFCFQPGFSSKVHGGDAGLFVPFFGTAELNWSWQFRAVLYFMGLCWCFMGVAIIADVFMGAIEEITAKRKAIVVGGKQFYVKVWNDTIANLTLMALGSSAPEILLSVIEIAGNDFLAGDLGPSTIVGSAAFNLLMIIAVCIVAIPKGEVRRVKDMNVLAITAFFSLFAYLYLIIVLQLISPNVVTVEEAAITLVLFFVLVGVAFAADIGYFSCENGLRKGSSVGPSDMGVGGMGQKIMAIQQETSGSFNPKEIASMLKSINKEYGDRISEEQKQHLVAVRLLANAPKSRAYYRVKATRELLAGKRIQGVTREQEKILLDNMQKKISSEAREALAQKTLNDVATKEREIKAQQSMSNVRAEDEAKGESTIEFSCALNSVLEGAGHATISVLRFGDIRHNTFAYYETKDGSASEGSDYEAVKGCLEFAAGETHKEIEVKIFDDDQWEPDEDFFVHLSLTPPAGVAPAKGESGCTLGDQVKCRVNIINDDEPGIIQFGNDVRTDKTGEEQFNLRDYNKIKNCYVVVEGQPFVVLTVHRKNGCSGVVTVKYATGDHIESSAVPGKDYTEAKGMLTFEDGETVKSIKIPIMEDESYERTEYFQVVLTAPTGGATFPADSEGGLNHEVGVVAIVDNGKVKSLVGRISSSLGVNADKMKLSSSTWKAQFHRAWMVNGGGEDDDDDDDDDDVEQGGDGLGAAAENPKPGCYDWTMHIISLPWKLGFAFCPPPEMGGGLPCFIVSLMMTGLVTALIGDLASNLGCVIGMKDATTAITLVALGTSLPDTFASMAAALGDKYADASVGNVTGSNSVNVFLGLGLPWLMAALVWGSRGSSPGWGTAQSKQWVKWNKYLEDAGLNAVQINKEYPNGAFVVPAGKLAFSVLVFSGTSVACGVLLIVRRKYCGGELGGPDKTKYASAALLCLLWFTYILMSTLSEYNLI
jgi:solute carrier family 8 (sodium/calcium exchanger)